MDKPTHKFAFGVYEADPASGELRKNGMKIKIQEQPFQILLMLLEHPGEVITREELRLRLWPADTFVDFDHGLNTAINKLREAVGDSASNPRFVETLARRGYRFIAPVKVLEPRATSAPRPTESILPQPEADADGGRIYDPSRTEHSPVLKQQLSICNQQLPISNEQLPMKARSRLPRLPSHLAKRNSRVHPGRSADSCLG